MQSTIVRNASSEYPALAAGDVTGIVAATLPVTDLAVSAAWYQNLLGLDYVREFAGGDRVTGCALADFEAGYMIAFRLRETTAGKADLRGEHPVILEVKDLAALDRIRARATALGYRPTSGEHLDAVWVEVVDPDGIATRFAVRASEPVTTFLGVRFDGAAEPSFYQSPRLNPAVPG